MSREDSKKKNRAGRSTWVLLGIFAIYLLIASLAAHFLPVRDMILKIRSFGLWAPFLFVALYLLRGFFYFPSLVFLVASFLLFSPLTGLTTYLLSVMASAALSFFIGRRFYERPFFQGLKKKISDPKIQERLSRRGALGVFSLHLIGFLDASNYLAGWLRLPFAGFYASVFLANSLTTGAFYLAVLHLPPVRHFFLN
ncbi:MAG: TVP38/TMEM64 family protein [Spirochaetia bacterium]|nr:TVP38/TMEM64 family protein [Spirochaetia bacterium]